MATTRIHRTAGTPTSQKKATVSFWAKMGNITANEHIFDTYTDSSNRSHIQFDDVDKIDVRFRVGNSNIGRIVCTPKFRDPSAWYHIVVALDTTQATNTDRIKLYINGVHNVSANNGFTTETYPSQNADVNLGGTHTIGAYHDGGSPSLYFSGRLTHVHYTDGYAYAASDFGETDSTSGIWKPKTSPSGINYGTNGFFLKFENSGNLDLDSSGNNLSFTTAGSLTQNNDTPSNNFATFNPLESPEPGEVPTYSNGNLQGVSTNGGHINGISSLAVETGKWYAEFKCTARSGGTDDFIGCIASPAGDLGSTNLNDAQSNNKSYGIRGDGSKYEAGTGASFAGSYAINDIIGVGIDATNNRLYFSKNGQWQNGTSWDSASPNSYITLPSSNTWHFLCGDTANSQNYTWQANFGSGFFGTTAVASANADANGFGAFEYAAPSGYYALCTKNIKEFG